MKLSLVKVQVKRVIISPQEKMVTPFLKNLMKGGFFPKSFIPREQLRYKEMPTRVKNTIAAVRPIINNNPDLVLKE